MSLCSSPFWFAAALLGRFHTRRAAKERAGEMARLSKAYNPVQKTLAHARLAVRRKSRPLSLRERSQSKTMQSSQQEAAAQDTCRRCRRIDSRGRNYSLRSGAGGAQQLQQLRSQNNHMLKVCVFCSPSNSLKHVRRLRFCFDCSLRRNVRTWPNTRQSRSAASLCSRTRRSEADANARNPNR